MNQGLIRWLDRNIGSALCLVLTAMRRLGDLFRRDRRLPAPKKILFIKLIEQGATVIASGAVRRAAKLVGPENVYFCVFAEHRPIVDLLELTPRENVIEIRGTNLLAFSLDLLETFVFCRREGIDTTVDMEFFARASAIIAYLTGARRRVGLHRFTSEAPYRGDLMTDRVQYNPYLHTAENYNLLVAALEESVPQTPLLKVPVAQIESPPARFSPQPDELARVAGLIDEVAGRPVDGLIVLLNPNAGDLLPLRRWEPERFIELGRRLVAEQPDVTVAITGAPSEREAALEVAAAIGEPPRVICLAGKTSLRDLLVTYCLADVLVTNDSGPGHFASLTDIHNIVLFGPETPQLFGPRGGRPHVIWEGLACSPCVNVLNHRLSPCTNNVCMQRIETERVHGEVISCLEEVRKRHASSTEDASLEGASSSGEARTMRDQPVRAVRRRL